MTATDAHHGAVLTLEQLTEQVERGQIDTVLLALTDMQGRLQGKRLTARHFLDEVAHHGAEGCNYLLAVDVDMTPVDGYEMASWERGYGDFAMRPDLNTLCAVPWQEGTAMCLADLEWGDGRDVLASPRQVLRAPGGTVVTCSPRHARCSGRSWPAWPSAAGVPMRAPSSSSWSSATPMRRPGARATGTSSRPTSTTSITRCSGPPGSRR